ncbi:GDH/6PGL endoplasmic bifunctional protein [Stigmatopora argus]
MYPTALLLLLALSATGGHGEDRQSGGHVSVVVVGGTGDLAKKYLWQGFFQLYLQQVSSGNSFSFYAAGQSPAEKATPIFFAILKAVRCPKDVSEERCAVVKDQFLRLSRYRQLKSLEDYRELSQDIEREVREEELTEVGRLFYLSVPAFAYAGIADKIGSSCRPSGDAVWLRVVLEKPFGHDLRSAQVLAAQLGNALRDEEMYRIDHYLGKQVVSKILPFRVVNKKFLNPIWNKHHIERIEIVLKETLDVQGRIPFYNEYGVIRDVIQNHLTEVLALLTMPLPANLSDSQELLQNKLQFFTSFLPLGKKQAVLGQYQAYQTEVRQELNKTKDHVAVTPTFAAVLAHMDTAQFEGVPILLVSGKMLDERVGYARVLFKSDLFCLQANVVCRPKQILFYFGHGSLQFPAVLVSKNLFRPSIVEGDWKEVTDHPDVHVLGSPLSDYYVQTPKVLREAYAELISQIFAGRKDSFIGTENLLASWGLWTPLLESLAGTFPRVYPGGVDNAALLDLHLKGKEIDFNADLVLVDRAEDPSPRNFVVTRGKFRGADMVSAWAEELVDRLAADLQAAAQAAVLRDGVFHLALSGGSTPIALFHRLALHHFAFPWGHTHIWMVDERCVPLGHPQSNFHNVHQHLLQHVRIPYLNIHPVAVEIRRRICAEKDGAPSLYREDIDRWIDGSKFHFVLLGVGQDMHTASLFPGTPAGLNANRLVVFTESPVEPHRRVSLTLDAINKAQRVALLVMGKSKHELVTQLSRVKDDANKWPVTGVKPTNGTLTWYIDYEALLR